MTLPVLARSPDYVVVAKPAHLLCHRTPGLAETDAVLQRVRDQLGQRVHLVHRLDRQTSGCLVLALRPEVVHPLALALAAGTKQYLAFVRGWYRATEPVLVRTEIPDGNGHPREARTWVVPVAGGPEPRCSLVLARPETGRHHQVRRHTRDLHHPVLCDAKHGDTRINRWWRETRGLGRMGLHCLTLDIPYGPSPISVVCPVPDDLRGVLSALPWWPEAIAAVPALALEPSGEATGGAAA